MRRTRRKWTAEEDNLLRDAVNKALEESRPLLWRELAKMVPGRTNKDCRRRWWNSIAGGTAKGPWTESEDERLISAVRECGTRWSQVAKAVGSRNSDQCSSHWSQALNPDINYSDWTESEDDRLWQEVQGFGTNWITIASLHAPKRTTLALKNRYVALRSKREAAQSLPSPADYTAAPLSRRASQASSNSWSNTQSSSQRSPQSAYCADRSGRYENQCDDEEEEDEYDQDNEYGDDEDDGCEDTIRSTDQSGRGQHDQSRHEITHKRGGIVMSQGAQAAKQSPFTLTRMFSDGPSPYPITQSLTPTEFISVEQPMVAYPGNIPLDLNYHLDGTQHAYMAGPGNPNMLGGGMAGSGGMPSAMHAWASMPPGHSPMQDYDILDPCMVHTTETTNSPSANLVGYEVATSSNSISSKSASSSNSNMIQYQTGSDQGPSTRASVSLSSDGQDEILRFPQSSIHYGSDLGEELHRVSIEALCTADELSDVISRVVGVARSVTVKVHK